MEIRNIQSPQYDINLGIDPIKRKLTEDDKKNGFELDAQGYLIQKLKGVEAGKYRGLEEDVLKHLSDDYTAIKYVPTLLSNGEEALFIRSYDPVDISKKIQKTIHLKQQKTTQQKTEDSIEDIDGMEADADIIRKIMELPEWVDDGMILSIGRDLTEFVQDELTVKNV